MTDVDSNATLSRDIHMEKIKCNHVSAEGENPLATHRYPKADRSWKCSGPAYSAVLGVFGKSY